MEGGTTFNFVTDGIEAALEQARIAADGKDIRLGGGASTVQQYLQAGLIDEMHVAISPILLGGGERLFDNLEGPVGYECVELVSTAPAVHARFTRKAS
jgi:dihydrofolate reductase